MKDINGIELKKGDKVERHISNYDKIAIGEVTQKGARLYFCQTKSDTPFLDVHPLDTRCRDSIGVDRVLSYKIIEPLTQTIQPPHKSAGGSETK